MQGHRVCFGVNYRAMPDTVYDLHAHTTASDGSLSPTELVQHAKLCAIDVLAVTDHDITLGIAEAQQAGRELGVSIVPGIEISVTWSAQTIHVVGLHINPDDSDLLHGLAELQTFRLWRAEEIGRRLDKAGIKGAYEGACRFANGKNISRTHFARFLVEQGCARDTRQVFTRYLVNNKPGYVPGRWASLPQALAWIHAAGGIAVLAHPARYRMTATKLRQLIGEFRELGGVALEVVSGSHSSDDMQHFARLSREMKLYASRGSDYHGPEQSYADPRRLPVLPPSCTPLWETDLWKACVENAA
jgi:predicted metal-dependent phosphoesterase TrpH